MKATTKFWFYFDETENFRLGEEAGFDLVLKIRPYHEDFRREGDQSAIYVLSLGDE
jgi:hypothetical protein